MTYAKTFIDVPIPSVAAAPSKPLEATVFVAASDARSDVKSLADFVCTGANDDVTIEQAINSLPAAGGRVVLSEGNYTFGSSLDILKSNVTLEGQGSGTVIKGAIGTSYIIVGNGSTALSNIKIANLAIDGTGQTSGHGIYFYGGSGYLITNSIIKNCWIKNCYSNGIRLYYSQNCIVIGNICSGSYFEGIFIRNSNNNLIIGNISQLNSSVGIEVYYSNYNVVNGNVCKDNSQIVDGIAQDIYLHYANYNIISNNILIATTTNRTQLGVFETSDCDYNLIHGNIAYGQTAGGYNTSGAHTVLADNIG